MPSPKQTKMHYKKCRRYFWLLLRALTEAHEAEVINYRPRGTKPGTPELAGVCDAVQDAKRNFKIATQEALADAFERECMDELKGMW